MSHLSRYLEQHERIQGLSLRDLANETGLGVETVRRALRGIGTPNRGAIEAFAKLLGVPFERLNELAESDRLGPFEAPEEWNLLDRDERIALYTVGQQLLVSSGKIQQVTGFEDTDDAPTGPPGARPKVPGRRRRSSY